MQKSISSKYTSANLILKENQEQGSVLLGDCNSVVDKQILKPYKIHTIITIGQDALPEKQEENIVYIFYPILDNKSQKIIEYLDKVFEEIQEGRKKGGVLVHCYTGISRSASFVIGYIMRKKFVSFDDARTIVRKHRNVAQPNDNFHRQLQSYWKILLKREEEERLKKEQENKEKIVSQIQPQSSVKLDSNSSTTTIGNISGISKKTIRGIRGAVKSAIFPENLFSKKSSSLLEVEEKQESTNREKVQQ